MIERGELRVLAQEPRSNFQAAHSLHTDLDILESAVVFAGVPVEVFSCPISAPRAQVQQSVIVEGLAKIVRDMAGPVLSQEEREAKYNKLFGHTK